MTSDRVALVTGGARGIGAEIARVLAAEGYRVGIIDLRGADQTVAEITAAGGVARSWEADIRSWGEVHDVVSELEDAWGPVSALAAVAGVWRPVRFRELDLDGWRAVVDVNLQGTFAVCRAVTESMARGGGGSVVVISSNAARLAFEGGVHYSASKAGLLGMVVGMAFELGDAGIRVNAISPGTIATDASAAEMADDAIRERQISATVLGRLGRPADIASVVSFLLDDDRSSWVTGQNWTIDGGYGLHGAGARDFFVTDTTVERHGGDR